MNPEYLEKRDSGAEMEGVVREGPRLGHAQTNCLLKNVYVAHSFR